MLTPSFSFRRLPHYANQTFLFEAVSLWLEENPKKLRQDVMSTILRAMRDLKSGTHNDITAILQQFQEKSGTSVYSKSPRPYLRLAAGYSLEDLPRFVWGQEATIHAVHTFVLQIIAHTHKVSTRIHAHGTARGLIDSTVLTEQCIIFIFKPSCLKHDSPAEEISFPLDPSDTKPKYCWLVFDGFSFTVAAPRGKYSERPVPQPKKNSKKKAGETLKENLLIKTGSILGASRGGFITTLHRCMSEIWMGKTCTNWKASDFRIFLQTFE